MKKQKLAIITGCNGFTGRYLVSFLRKRRKSFKIIGVDIQRKAACDVDIYVKSNLSKELPFVVQKELEEAKEVLCFHLAGLIFEKDIEKMYKNNLSAAYNTFYSLVPYKEKTTILNVGSSAEYGYQGKRGISESRQPEPVSSYGFCKLAQTELAESFFEAYDLPIIMTRTFNIIGPGQTDNLVCGKIVKQIVGYKKGINNKVVVQGTETYRDFLDVRDAVRGYVLLVEEGTPGELYNIASGEAIRIKKVLDSVLEIVGVSPEIIKKTKDDFKQNIPYQKASIRKVHKKTGWIPSYEFNKSIKDMINLEARKKKA